jgi:Sulfatase
VPENGLMQSVLCEKPVMRQRGGGLAGIVAGCWRSWRLAGVTLNVTVRLAFSAVVLIACFYCLLTYIPFTYYAVIQNPFLTWLKFFASFYKYIYLATLVPLGAVLLRNAEGERTTRVARSFVVVHVFVGIVLLFSPPLASLPRDPRSFIWSLAIPFPLCWLGLIDHSSFAEWGGWSRMPGRRNLRLFTVIEATLVVALAFAANSYFRYVAVTRQGWLRAMPAVAVSIAEHLLLGIFVFAVLSLVREVLARMRAAALTEFIVASMLFWLACAVIFRKLVLASLSFNNSAATLFAVVVTLQIAVFVTGLSLCVYRSARSQTVDAFALPLFVLTALFTRRAFFWIVALGGAYAIPAILARSDWDMLFQRLCAVFLWFAALAYSIGSTYGRGKGRRSPFLILNLLALALFSFWAARQVGTPRFLDRYSGCAQQGCVSDDVEQYSGFDGSFKAVHDVFAPTFDDGEHGDFYRFLRRNTNIATPIRPVEINIAGKLEPNRGTKPHIFLFVIDSLRPDYLSPYNPAVDFTPAIAQFARESDVMRNAFTRYGGTALAEPSIWAGAMQIHKQYVQPYYPMNALQKLLDVEHYDSYVTLDPILRAIIGKSASIVELDGKTTNQNYDLCTTLKEIEHDISTRTDTSRPIFVYTQPLNVHVTGLYFAKSRRQPQRKYPGFDADHAAELERLDVAFGEFIQFLKDRGLYDNSIVVVTADHGDSIGEYGRYGHTGPPFPEIAKIPLIIHVPSRLRESLVYDSKKFASNIDITPTLYYLLGHRDLTESEIVGRSLYATTPEELAKSDRPNYLIVSSYSPVYGILARDGPTLFITDAQSGTNYFYDLSQDPKGLHNRVTNAIRDEGERLIRAHVSELNRFYDLHQ